MDDALDNIRDALADVLEIDRDQGKPLPAELTAGAVGRSVWIEMDRKV